MQRQKISAINNVIPDGGVAQLVRASACHAEGRGFEPLHSRHLKTASAVFFLYLKSLSPKGSRPIPPSFQLRFSPRFKVLHWFTLKNSSPNCFPLRTHSRHLFHKTLFLWNFFCPFLGLFSFPSQPTVTLPDKDILQGLYLKML